MSAIPTTWGGNPTSPANASIDTDTVLLSGSAGFSAVLMVTGSGAHGISGNIEVVVANLDQTAAYAILPGSVVYAVNLGPGQVQNFAWSSQSYYKYARIRWTQAGIGNSGTLGLGEVNLVAPAPSVAAAQPVVQAPSPFLQAAYAQAFGLDFVCGLGDLSFATASGIGNLSLALIRRFITPRGGLFYDPDYGTDVRDLVAMAMGPGDQARWEGLLEDEAQKDERVLQSSVDLEFDEESNGWNIGVTGMSNAGPFSLILNASQLGVKLLEASPS